MNASNALYLVSAGKFITHLACLQLVEHGLVTLDEPIYRLIPELEALPVITANGNYDGTKPDDVDNKPYVVRAQERPLTLRHMLTNSSGIPGGETDLILAYEKDHPPVKYPDGTSMIIQRFTLPLLFQPGEGWEYGHDVHFLQVVIERATGMKFVKYQQEQIFDRLDMKATAYLPLQKEGMKEKMMQVVQRTEDGGLKPASEGAVAGIMCSVEDVQKLLGDLVSLEPRLVSRKMMDEMVFAPGLVSPSSSSYASSATALEAFRSQASDFAAAPANIANHDANPDVNYSVAGAMYVEKQTQIPKGSSLGQAREKGKDEREVATRLASPAGSLCWDGMPNVAWVANRDRGIAIFFGTQLLPEYDERVMSLMKEFFPLAWASVA